MRMLRILAITLTCAARSPAADPLPTAVTSASCSGPAGTATLALTTNPFVAGQWIAVREVPPSAAAINGEKLGVGYGSTRTFTFRTASYPIRRGSVTILAGGVLQGKDTPARPYPGAGQLDGPGVGTFTGTVTITGGTAVTLTSTPAVFDARWGAFMPTIAGVAHRYIIGSGTDSTHLTLMAPAPNGAGQSFEVVSQVNYNSGVIEVTFNSAPAPGVAITINYTTEPSLWNGEHKILSATSTTVSYQDTNCVSARARAVSGEAYAIPVIYVAPASHAHCAYDGDGEQACVPRDRNPGTTKSRPKATLAGVHQALNRTILTIPYLVQLADANGTGLGGSAAQMDCYAPNEMTFSNVTMGGSPVDENEWLRVDRYPESYLWFHGNSRHPGNVLFNGSGSCASSSRGVATAEALRFDRTAARVDGISIQGYGNRVRPGMGPSAITFVHLAAGYVENMICKGSRDLDPTFFSLCIGAWDHSTVKVGGTHTISNANWIHAINESNLFTADPVDGATENTVLNYFSDTETFAMGCSIMSNCQIDRLTANFTGSGRFTAELATEKSAFYFAERYVGSQCPNAACFGVTINAPNMIWESAQLGAHIDSSCDNSQEGFCTLISGPAVRAYAQEDSYIKEYGLSVITGPDIEVAGGCVAVWDHEWQSPTCSSLLLKSESKTAVPLTLQSAPGSTADLLDLKTGDGALAVSFNSSGQISKFHGIATAGNGVAGEVYSTASAAINASLSATTMLAPAADGTFRAQFYVTQVDAGAGCTAPAKVAVNLIYSDPYSGATQPFTFRVPLTTSGAASASSALPLSTGPITAANVATGSVTFRAKGSTDIQYSTTFNDGSCSTQPKYRVVPVLEWF